MKLLLDQNLSHKIIQKINSPYPDSKHVVDYELQEADDIDIWKYATQNDFVMVTQDVDFYELALLSDLKGKIIWLRCGNTSTQNIIDSLLNNFDKIAEFNDSEEKCLQLF